MGNPYTLRADLLNQARDILYQQYHQECTRVTYMCERGLADPQTVTWPKAPTTEQILEEAEKLYKFVQTK